MNERDRPILAVLAERIRNRFPEAEVRLFGSRARGTSSTESDMDVCVILRKLDRQAREQISHIAWEVGFEHDIVITTIKYSREEFFSGPRSVSPLTKNIMQEGVPA